MGLATMAVEAALVRASVGAGHRDRVVGLRHEPSQGAGRARDRGAAAAGAGAGAGAGLSRDLVAGQRAAARVARGRPADLQLGSAGVDVHGGRGARSHRVGRESRARLVDEEPLHVYDRVLDQRRLATAAVQVVPRPEGAAPVRDGAVLAAAAVVVGFAGRPAKGTDNAVVDPTPGSLGHGVGRTDPDVGGGDVPGDEVVLRLIGNGSEVTSCLLEPAVLGVRARSGPGLGLGLEPVGGPAAPASGL